MLKVSAEVDEIIELSKVISKNFGHSFVGTEHLLLALMGRKKSEEYIRLSVPGANNISYSHLMKEVVDRNGKGERLQDSSRELSSNYKKVLSKGYIRAFSRNSNAVEMEDVVKVLFDENGCTAFEIFEACKKTCLSSDSKVMKTFSLDKEKLSSMRKETPVLNIYSRDVTLAALEDKLDPVIERDAEMERVIGVLLRKNKNNPCLVGSAGVGKTAIADGIARRIVKGNVPYELCQKRIVALDFALLLAGAKYRGDFEERLKGVFEEVKKCRNVILLIDEIHNIVNTGNGEGTLDAANILKPELARGDVSIIGATTAEEYSRTIEKDAALERRFQKIIINEPSPKVSKRILCGLKPRYEAFHKIKIDDSAITKAVDISVKELPNRYLPDKAIDIIDEASAFVRLEGKESLNEEDVVRCFERTHGNKAFSVDELNLKIKKRLHGQDKAIDKAVEAIADYKGAFFESAPLTVLFVGPTGCGKTTLARLISDNVFGEHSLLKVDMGEYSEKHSVSKLIGAPPGYVGYQDNGILTNAIMENPNRVILFDEIEKAHSDVLKVLLNLLDDGVLRNTSGKSISFKKCIIILTSNSGFNGGSREIGFSNSNQSNVSTAVEAVLGREIMGRIDYTVLFEKANEESARRICDCIVEEYRRICIENRVSLEIDDDVYDCVIKRCDFSKFGYRNVKKVFAGTVGKELKRAWRLKDKGLTKVRIYTGKDGEVTHFSYFKKNSLENNELSMYNKIEV